MLKEFKTGLTLWGRVFLAPCQRVLGWERCIGSRGVVASSFIAFIKLNTNVYSNKGHINSSSYIYVQFALCSHCGLLGCGAVQFCWQIHINWRNLLIPHSEEKSLDTAGSSKWLVSIYHTTLCPLTEHLILILITVRISNLIYKFNTPILIVFPLLSYTIPHYTKQFPNHILQNSSILCYILPVSYLETYLTYISCLIEALVVYGL